MSKQPFYNSEESILPSIYFIRGEKVILDRDLATLYGVETKRLKEAVKRNIQRFPLDFMFELTDEEFKNWRTQFASSNSDKMGLRYNPMAFTEQGIAMLSSVVNNPRAIEVNIAIMRTFVKIRKTILQNTELSNRLYELEDANYVLQFIQGIFHSLNPNILEVLLRVLSHSCASEAKCKS